MITCANSLYRERDAQPSGRCFTSHHVRYRAVPRTNRLHRRRILATVSPHPVQAHSQPATHCYLGNALVPTHRQVNVPTSPVRVVTRSCLGSLHQQEAQQRIALLADVPEPLLAATVNPRWGSFPRSCRSACHDEIDSSSNDQHVGECRKRAHARMSHQPQRLGSFPGLLFRGRG
jgi:hypothetical protein